MGTRLKSGLKNPASEAEKFCSLKNLKSEF